MLRAARLDAPATRDASQPRITGLSADSREVRPGFLFAALPGARHDGAAFIGDAVRRGAVAVLAAPGIAWPEDVARQVLVEHPQPRAALARLAAVRQGCEGPAQPGTLVAVTGTNGKTSTVEFLRQLWALGGRRAASLGTLGVVASGHPAEGGLTTPGPVELSRLLGGLAADGIGHAALEASSHGLDQCRLDGLRLSAGGFSNLSRDHLDYHGGLDAYRSAKLRLFGELLAAGSPCVANADMDPDTLSALRSVAAARSLRWGSVGERGEDWRLLSAQARPDGQVLRLRVHGQLSEAALSLPGRFQADNVLLAAALAESCGEADVLARLEGLHGVRGRMELAVRAGGWAAYVDYAHTPDALSRLLSALRPHASGRLVCVFGAGGDRDAGKRPLMGQAVAQGADLAIVTDDNPRFEEASAIRAAVLAGCAGGLEIADRRQAIAAGLEALRPGDVLVVAGKGHEGGQSVRGQSLPFDDASVLRALAGTA